MQPHAARQTPAVLDDEPAHLGDVDGIASLFARGDAGRRTLPMAPEDLLKAGVLIYLRGLGLMAEPPPGD